MKAIAIDTSNLTLGIALLDETKVIGEYVTNLKKNHSVRAMPAVEWLMQECDTKPEELERVIVAKGPGSYTGLRIGVSIAKTLAWTLNIPLVGVSSLEVLAAGGTFFNGFLCPLFDARRGQVYTGLYEYGENGVFMNCRKDQNVLLSDWLEELKKEDKKILFLGNDVSMHHEVILETLKSQAVIASMTEHNPRPAMLGKIGLTKEPEDIHTFVPNYIRLAEAEVKWLEQQK
ncbi:MULTISPECIES: tRNA (adenosine(37)-N6)-threonylcarbamoyltransferase complex dimerization subunit type 1 TsaB [Bacillaceae]|uniref:tRNA (adenosine(37)-N6)-threonylcarbamoyltransferase complex dimerization subunit type 1 TsaB n=1 Tax=Bacillaceae TaxID=186817 RepID=UPI000C79240A|nr:MULTISPECIES: tRNA (adenosine(37)-N6)-threonylcarbamoyltransferase complex dimerization subunit type 1 TsaB [Bacillaceae]PLR65577.1 tRNA (adenosine(37)-N6)-threonylcarbamoyltransferase complex dimerization subunit type 1 TsaB [Bacillus sp. UMB0893]